MSGYSEAELKARALREAAEDVTEAQLAQRHIGEWLMQRAADIEQGNDPAVPTEPMEAGSRLRCRNGDVYLRWCTGDSHTVSPWTDPMGHLDGSVRYSELDVVEVWPADPLPD